MSEDAAKKIEIEHDGEIEHEIGWLSFFLAVGAVFLWFWLQNGWYRVDCALKVQKACDLIEAEYAKKSKP